MIESDSPSPASTVLAPATEPTAKRIDNSPRQVIILVAGLLVLIADVLSQVTSPAPWAGLAIGVALIWLYRLSKTWRWAGVLAVILGCAAFAAVLLLPWILPKGAGREDGLLAGLLIAALVAQLLQALRKWRETHVGPESASHREDLGPKEDG